MNTYRLVTVGDELRAVGYGRPAKTRAEQLREQSERRKRLRYLAIQARENLEADKRLAEHERIRAVIRAKQARDLIG